MSITYASRPVGVAPLMSVDEEGESGREPNGWRINRASTWVSLAIMGVLASCTGIAQRVGGSAGTDTLPLTYEEAVERVPLQGSEERPLFGRLTFL